MSRIYEMADGRKAALYSEGSRILFYTFPVRRGNLPAVVKEDYLQDLTTIEFRGNLFFAYKNLEKQIVLDSLGVAGEMILLTEGGITGEISGIRLGQAGGNLCLYYIREAGADAAGRENPTENAAENPVVLEVVFPYRNREKHRISDALARPAFDVYAVDGQPVLVFQKKTGGWERYLWRDGRFQREPGREELLEAQEKELCRVKEDCARKLEEERARGRAEQEKAEAAYRHEMEDYQERLQKAARQYEELAAVARNMQEALRKLT